MRSNHIHSVFCPWKASSGRVRNQVVCQNSIASFERLGTEEKGLGGFLPVMVGNTSSTQRNPSLFGDGAAFFAEYRLPFCIFGAAF